MTDEQLEQYELEVLEARTEEEIRDVAQKWNPILAKCFRSTSTRVKELNAKMDQLREEVLRATTEISARITELHKRPTFKDNKVEWIMNNIEKILLTIIVLSLVFGRDFVSHLIK